MHPVAKGLPVHPSRLCLLASLMALQQQCDSEQPSHNPPVQGLRRQLAQLLRGPIQTPDLDRSHPSPFSPTTGTGSESEARQLGKITQLPESRSLGRLVLLGGLRPPNAIMTIDRAQNRAVKARRNSGTV